MSSWDTFLSKFDAADKPILPPGVVILIDPTKCIRCGLCADVCPFGLPKQDDAGMYHIPKHEKCIECSACYRNCPTHAILMEVKYGCGCLWNVLNDNKKQNRGKPEPQSSGCCPSK